MRRVLASTALVALLVAAPAHAEIYRWIDDAGRVHLDDDVANVPEAQREGARVFKSKVAQPVDVSGTTEAALASGVVRELGLAQGDTQDAVSVLQVVGIYPAAGWNAYAALSSRAVHDVVAAARTAARANRVRRSEAAAEAAVLRAASALGVAGPPPAAPPEPEPAPVPPPIIVAPNIIVEAPAPAVVVQQPAPRPVLDYSTFAYGVPFAPLPIPPVQGPVPQRITPLADPGGRLHGPLITPLRSSPFTRPAGF